MDKKQLSVLIIVGLILFLLGGALGVISQQKGAQAVKIQTVDNLASKVISSIAAYGQVAKIEGRNITLNYLGDNLVVSVASNATIYSLEVKAGSASPVQKIVSFGDIKVGDNVNVVMKLLPSSKMEGSSVIIFPAQ